MIKNHKEAPAGYHWVYTSKIRLKTGEILYARDFGKKAFCFLAINK